MKKIKIVFIHARLDCGGAEQALYDLIHLMDKSKYDITLLVQLNDGVWEQKFRDTGVKIVHYFDRRKRDGSILHFIRHQLRKIRIHGYLALESRGLIDFYFPEGVDIIVNYSASNDNYFAFSKIAGSVMFVHGDVADNEMHRKGIERIMRSLPRYQRIICVSEKSRCSFMELTGLSNTVELHYNPINSDRVREMAEEPVVLPVDVPVICAVGRLAPEKGYDRLIRIHKKILDMGVTHKLLIVGGGPEQEKLERIIEETGTMDTVIMAGYQENPYPYMKNSKFIVCSSYTEGLPVISMEAMILGIPMVSSAPSIAETFGDEMCGLITDMDDESLKMGIYKMLTDQDLYQRTKAGAERRGAFFNGNRMVAELEEVFDSVLK